MSNGLFSSIVGTCAGSYRNLMGRAVKVGGPAGGLVGVLADLGAPVADLVLYFTLACAAITLAAGIIWFGKRQKALRAALSDGKITQEELAHATESSGWSITFAFGLVATVVLGIVFLAQAVVTKPDDGPERGVVATLVPALQKMQDSMFKIEKDVAEIKTVTGETKAQTERIENKTEQVITKLDDLSRLFEEVSKRDGLIPNPQTPAEHYHNARFAEVKSDFATARKSYNAFLASGVEFIDPYLAYTDMLKVQDGAEGAREVIATLRKSNTTLSLEAAEALLLPKTARTGTLKKLIERAPEYAPAVYLLSREFSAEKLGEQTIADKKEEKAALDQFRALNEKGQFQKYVLDKKEGKKWMDDVDARYARLAAMPDQVLKTPVTLSAQQSNQGWMITLGFADYKVKKIEYRLDEQGDFKDTGLGTVANPQTGLPMPNPFFNAENLKEGEHTVEVRYVDMTDKVNGPYKLSFNTNTAAIAMGKQVLNQLAPTWVMFRDYEGKTLLYFTSLLSYRGALKTIRYSLDTDALDKTYPFKPPAPGEGAFTIGEGLPYIEVPAATKSACVQLEYADGTLSEKKTFQKP